MLKIENPSKFYIYSVCDNSFIFIERIMNLYANKLCGQKFSNITDTIKVEKIEISRILLYVLIHMWI